MEQFNDDLKKKTITSGQVETVLPARRCDARLHTYIVTMENGLKNSPFSSKLSGFNPQLLLTNYKLEESIIQTNKSFCLKWDQKIWETVYINDHLYFIIYIYIFCQTNYDSLEKFQVISPLSYFGTISFKSPQHLKVNIPLKFWNRTLSCARFRTGTGGSKEVKYIYTMGYDMGSKEKYNGSQY